MAERDDLALGLGLDVGDERGGLLEPLRPAVDVATLALAPAMTAQVDGVGGHAVRGHAAGEAFVATCMLAESMHDHEGDRSAGEGPGPIGKPRAVGGVDKAFGADRRRFRRQGARILGASSAPPAPPPAAWVRRPSSRTGRTPIPGWTGSWSGGGTWVDRRRSA